jgi:rhodanese-related sulfurtransferase
MERLFEFIGNNSLWVSVWFALLILLLWNLFKDNLLGIAQLDPIDVTRRINNDHAVVVDLRNSDDYQSGHILNAINIPETELAERKRDLEKLRKKPIILCCQSGSISTRTVQQLKSDGFDDVSIMKGGILTWQRASLPLTRV